jgi:hypothetical protein
MSQTTWIKNSRGDPCKKHSVGWESSWDSARRIPDLIAKWLSDRLGRHKSTKETASLPRQAASDSIGLQALIV